MIPPVLESYIPLILGAVGAVIMLPVTITLYRRYLKGPIAAQTKHTFVEAANDEDFVVPLKDTLLWRELSGETAHQIQLVTSRIDSFPNSIGEVVDHRLEESVKTMGNHFSQNLETAVTHIQKQIKEVEEKFTGSKRFGNPNAMSPQEAQAKGVESRRVNQIVNTLEEQVMGPSMIAKANELAQFLASVGQPELADWLDENQDAVTKIERRIRANPALAARLQQFQQRFAGGRQGQSTVVDI